jgi:hypothetical protein
MNIKLKYLQAIKTDNGCHDEIYIGEKLGLDVNSTMRIINVLLAEYRLEYVENRACNYSVK